MDISYSFLYVFFFKQKTAYEVRIIDWSSDVCSSDLHRNFADFEPREGSLLPEIPAKVPHFHKCPAVAGAPFAAKKRSNQMPVRNVITRSGRHFRGLYPSRKVGRMVVFESILERDVIMLREDRQRVVWGKRVSVMV